MKTVIFRKNIVIGLIILFALTFVMTIVARGTTIYVDADNASGPWDGTLGHPYQHIQDGINNASAGDTVYVFKGTYYEYVDVNKAINLIGENKDSTVIHIQPTGWYVNISANRVNLSGFTVQNSGAYGIYVLSDSNTIVNNIVKSGWYAMIYLFGGSYSTVSENTVIGWGGGSVGIKERYGSNNAIIGNLVDNMYYFGISSEIGASNTLISNNTVVNCQGPSICLLGAYYDIIIDNSLDSGSVYIEGDTILHWNTHTIEGNHYNGRPIYYYKNNSDTVTVPSDAGQVILANCSNFTIQNLNISGVRTAIQLGFSSGNNITGNTIIDNTGSWTGSGIELNNSSNNHIAGNSITNNESYHSNGIYLHFFSDSNSIFGNTIVANSMGIYVENSCSYNIISDNTVTDNGTGIALVHEAGHTCKDNMVYHNNLINNGLNADAVEQEVDANIWDDGYSSGGNYWSDFDEPGEGAYDKNGDGIVDSAYNISGIYNRDRYPLMNPWDGTPSTPPCGDATGDGNMNSADIVWLINYLFVGGPQPWPALCVGDVNGDENVNSSDIVYLINYLFIAGPSPQGCCAH